MIALENATAEVFRTHEGSTFSARLDENKRAELILEKVELTGKTQDERGRPFSLIFRSTSNQALEQRTYELEHPELGALTLFLVPLQPDEKGARYEAVFN